MRFIDLFCGIGAFHQALLDHECVMACDIDPMCRETYKVNYNIDCCEDIKDIKNVPQADIVCAGIPCVSFSIMGKKQGLNDERGRLIDEVFRIVRLSNPKYVFIENVRNILKCGDTIDYITKNMKTFGYNVYVKLLNCKDFGIPQNRQRVFIICSKIPLSLDFTPYKKKVLLGDYLNQDILRETSYTIRANGGRYAKLGSKYNWTEYLKRDKSVYKLTLEDVIKLQGFPKNFFLCGSTTKQYCMLGNTIPLCLTKAVILATFSGQ